MILLIGEVVILLGWAGSMAWIANIAAARGRSQVAWIAVGIVVSVVCVLAATMAVPLAFGDRNGDITAPVLALLVPFVAMFFSLFGLGVWLRRRPVKVPATGQWPVCCRINGNGQLVIADDAIRLVWQDRTQDIPRAQLRSVAQDGESLRLVWSDGELELVPMLRPQTRDGRIQQCQTLARLLAPSLPPAIQVSPSA